MKKYFIFAAIAAAGLLTSCSSDDNIASEVTPNPVEGEDLTPIQIGVGQSTSVDVTRGTGTVGGLAGDAKNIWAGEHVNVFMFVKGTFKLAGMYDKDGVAIDGGVALYDNTEMRTPQSDENATGGVGTGTDYGVAQEYETDSDDKTYVKHKYYPAQGKFDFWGYHADDAATTVTTNDDGVQVGFTIDGTQDLMTAVAWPVEGTTNWIPSARTGATETAFPKTSNDFYSAKAARAGLQPELQFKHLLTRLEFQVKAGNRRAAGLDPSTATPDLVGSIYNGVFVRDIKVYSRETGTLLAAYNYWANNGTKPEKEPKDLITWDVNTGTTLSGTDKVTDEYKTAITAGTVVPFSVASDSKYDDTALTPTLYTETEANTHNASLTNAIPVDGTTLLTSTQANAYNAKLTGAVKAGDAVPADYETKVGSAAAGTTLTAAEAISYNATLTGAVRSQEQANAYNATLTGAVAEGDLTTTENNAAINAAAGTTYSVGDAISAAAAIAYNATLAGHVTAAAVPTPDANTYNATLPGAVTTATVKIPAHKIGDVKPLYDVATYGPVASGVVNDAYKTAWETALATSTITTSKKVCYPKVVYDSNNADVDGTPVGGPIMVSPEMGYRIVVTLGEYLVDKSIPDPDRTEDGETIATANKSAVTFTTLDPIDITTSQTVGGQTVNGFLPETSYKVRITAYNAQEIVITTSLAGWKTGTTSSVDLE